MNDKKIAARFAAFVWYLNQDAGKPAAPREAGRLARENWEAFLPYADGKLRRLVSRRDPVRRHMAIV